jgi:ornithine--oxo-acid transaminase
VSSIRFAPPLVIEEEDLERAIKIIEECLEDLDKVSLCLRVQALMVAEWSTAQLDEIPGEVESEKGFKDALSN